MQFGAVFFVFEVLYFGVCLGMCIWYFVVEIMGSIFCIQDCVFWSVSLVLRSVYLVVGGMQLVYEGVLWYWVFVFHMWRVCFVFCTCFFPNKLASSKLR